MSDIISRRFLLAALRYNVDIRCAKLCSDKRKNHQRVKFYLCANASQTAIDISTELRSMCCDDVEVIVWNEFRGGRSVVLRFPFNAYC